MLDVRKTYDLDKRRGERYSVLREMRNRTTAMKYGNGKRWRQ